MKNNNNIDIMRYLAEGSQNARSGNELRALLKLDHYRDVTRLIQKARSEGNIICSSTHGFFLPQNKMEVREFTRVMHSRIKEIKKSVQYADEFLKEGAIYD